MSVTILNSIGDRESTTVDLFFESMVQHSNLILFSLFWYWPTWWFSLIPMLHPGTNIWIKNRKLEKIPFLSSRDMLINYSVVTVLLVLVNIYAAVLLAKQMKKKWMMYWSSYSLEPASLASLIKRRTSQHKITEGWSLACSHNWTMDYALNWQFCVRWVWLKFFTGTRLQKASLLLELYKSHFLAFHEYLEITHIS
jgi:hypothetical protein